MAAPATAPRELALQQHLTLPNMPAMFAGVEGGITQDQLLANFRDDVWSNTCVMLLRFITSAEIKRRSDHFEPFILVRARGRALGNGTGCRCLCTCATAGSHWEAYTGQPHRGPHSSNVCVQQQPEPGARG
jgi:hypothetical protein